MYFSSQPSASTIPMICHTFIGHDRRDGISRRQDGRRGHVIRAADLIERKRDGEEHSPEEIAALVAGFASGEIPDYQMAAWCMAVYFRGLSGRETHALTEAFIRSGGTLDMGAALGRRVVDKHSTGGVGDKTSIAVGPIVAACGVPFGKMSGRGLGHTGGTLDKLESIPGFRVELTTEEFVAQVREIGLAIVGTSDDLVPADKSLYGLRDVTATVDIAPDSSFGHVEEDRRRCRRDRAGREGRRRGHHEDARRRTHPR
jgi:thymidine phosphorylase